MTGFYATEIALLYDRHMLMAAVPEIHVRKAAEAKEFYSDKLGFACANSWRPDQTKEDPCYMSFVRDGVWLQVASFKGVLGTVVYVYVDDVDALHAEFVAKGVQDISPVVDQTWGTREFAVTDPDQNTLRFGQLTEP
jgi:uncharacterized glyoxalase superfamily protein PhnB